MVDGIDPDGKIGPSFSVENPEQDLDKHIAALREFAAIYPALAVEFYELAWQKYANTPYALDKEQVKAMYFLSGVELK